MDQQDMDQQDMGGDDGMGGMDDGQYDQ